MRSTMPRSMAHRASSLRLQWLSGKSPASAGFSQASATIKQICSGVKVAGAPGARGVGQALNDRRGVRRRAPAAQPVAHRLRPDVELASGLADAGSRSGQQDQLGTFGQFLWRRVGSRSAGSAPALAQGSTTMGLADSRGIEDSADREVDRRFAMPDHSTIDPRPAGLAQAIALFFFQLWHSGLTYPDMESPLPACGTRVLELQMKANERGWHPPERALW